MPKPLRKLVPGATAAQLDKLAKQINASLQTGETTRLECFHRAGQYLSEAKALHGDYGNWADWLKNNCPSLHERKAQRLMALAKYDVTSDLKAAWRQICGNDRVKKDSDNGPALDNIEDGTSNTIIPGDVSRQFAAMVNSLIRKRYGGDERKYLPGYVLYDALQRYYVEIIRPSTVALSLVKNSEFLAAWERCRGA